MSSAAKTIFTAGIYFFFLGAGLVLVPSVIFHLFQIQTSDYTWVRVIGIITLGLSIYYVASARAEARAFFNWTVPVRCAVCVGFLGLVLTGLAPPILSLFAIADLLGAAATGFALRRDRNDSVAGLRRAG